MRKIALVALLAAASLFGCHEPVQRVVSTLPEPYIEPLPVPSPQPQPVIKPSPATTPPQPPVESWLPPRGIGRRWNSIIIHHTASDLGSLKDIDQWHRDKNWEHGCGYDFVIGNGTRSGDGKIEVSQRWRQQITGAHTRLSAAFARKKGISPNYYNENGIGIVMIGNFDKTTPSVAQLQSLARLVSFLMRECNIPESRIYTHGGPGGVDQTHCPGRNFSLYQFKLMLRGVR